MIINLSPYGVFKIKMGFIKNEAKIKTWKTEGSIINVVILISAENDQKFLFVESIGYNCRFSFYRFVFSVFCHRFKT